VRRAFTLLLLAVTPGVALAQASQFGVRGLGFPGRPFTARGLASGGAFGLFDPESSLNPAALGGATALTSVFTISSASMHQENPAGTSSTRNIRFPLLMVVGPVRGSKTALGLSYSSYTSRDFSVARAYTIDLRGVPVGVTDSLSSRGGLSDLRLAGSVGFKNGWQVGGGFHVITGSNRLEARRSFSDVNLLPSHQLAEVSYAGVGVSVGLIRQLGSGFAVAALARSDGHLNVDRDSTPVGKTDLPYTFGLGLRWHPLANLDVAGQTIVRTWSGANSDLLQQGGTGASNTLEVSGGLEYTPDPKRPYRRPIRLGGHYAQLPFPLIAGEQGHEYGISGGSGMRFAQQRGGIDLTLEHTWRSEGAYSEHGFTVTVGISVRP
jgi:hypothetical protein